MERQLLATRSMVDKLETEKSKLTSELAIERSEKERLLQEARREQEGLRKAQDDLAAQMQAVKRKSEQYTVMETRALEAEKERAHLVEEVSSLKRTLAQQTEEGERLRRELEQARGATAQALSSNAEIDNLKSMLEKVNREAAEAKGKGGRGWEAPFHSSLHLRMPFTHIFAASIPCTLTYNQQPTCNLSSPPASTP